MACQECSRNSEAMPIILCFHLNPPNGRAHAASWPHRDIPEFVPGETGRRCFLVGRHYCLPEGSGSSCEALRCVYNTCVHWHCNKFRHPIPYCKADCWSAEPWVHSHNCYCPGSVPGLPLFPTCNTMWLPNSEANPVVTWHLHLH